MSEQQLKDFGAHAETLVDVPDFAAIDARGRNLRARRRMGVAATLVAVLAAAGVVATQSHRTNADSGPVTPPDQSTAVQPYPGATMKTLAERTYELHPSLVQSSLVAQLTVPAGWNAWVGPNRFDGHAPGRSNEDALGHLTWYAGALVLEVNDVNSHGCGNPSGRTLFTRAEVVAGLTRAFSMEVIRAPEHVRRFGHPATRMRLRVTGQADECTEDTAAYSTTADGFIGYAGPGTVMDVWVVDLGGRAIYVQKAWTPNTPRTVRDELDGIIGSVRFSNVGE